MRYICMRLQLTNNAPDTHGESGNRERSVLELSVLSLDSNLVSLLKSSQLSLASRKAAHEVCLLSSLCILPLSLEPYLLLPCL